MSKKRRATIAATVMSAAMLTSAGLYAAQAAPGDRGGPASLGDGYLLNVDYESGTENSGIDTLTTTHALADDSSYIVPGGAHGSNYAIAHKVTLGDPGYFSDGAYRSESANDQDAASRFGPGSTQRYEFSIQLPNGWEDWSPGESPNGEMIFQGKHAGGNSPSWLIITKRNEIAFRSPGLKIQLAVIPDYRPHIGQWMDFRVDVHWATDATGYYKVWTRLDGDPNYTKVLDLKDLPTWHPVNPADHGYVKWGLYRAGTSLAAGDVPTRIVYHDDIRVMDHQ